MTSSYLEDEDRVFYGGKKSSDKSSKQEEDPHEDPQEDPYEDPADNEETYEDAYEGDTYDTPSSSYSTPEDTGSQVPRNKEVTEEDLERQIKESRLAKRKAESVHDITILRQRAAEQSALGAKFYKKYRAEEAQQVKHEQAVAKYRRKSEKYQEKVKDVEVKIADKEASLSYLEDGKLERAHVKIAKLKGKIAKLKSKSSSAEAKAAKHRQKAVARKRKATEFLEKNKIHEAEAKAYNNRANRLEKITS